MHRQHTSTPAHSHTTTNHWEDGRCHWEHAYAPLHTDTRAN